MDIKDKIFSKFFEGLCLGNKEALDECEELINQYESEKEESEEKINTRFLRGKQDEIDNLRKQLEKEESKSKYYSDLYYQQSLEYDKLLAENKRLLDLLSKNGPIGATGISN